MIYIHICTWLSPCDLITHVTHYNFQHISYFFIYKKWDDVSFLTCAFPSLIKFNLFVKGCMTLYAFRYSTRRTHKKPLSFFLFGQKYPPDECIDWTFNELPHSRKVKTLLWPHQYCTDTAVLLYGLHDWHVNVWVYLLENKVVGFFFVFFLQKRLFIGMAYFLKKGH